jgi:dipeptidyl aminopeptidase/acylaminoacyl peptidase
MNVILQRRCRRVALFTILIAIAILAYQLVAVRGVFAPLRPASSVGGAAIVIGAQGHRIAGREYLRPGQFPVLQLIVVIHGDAPFVKPGYHYAFASALADRLPGTRVVAILRPGYTDPYGGASDGDRGFALGDNYDRADVDQIADAVRLLRSQSPKSQTILIGHSGGAALSALIAARYPRLITYAFLAGCPCDVPAFRLHMAREQWNPLWLLPVNSLSPFQTLEQTRSSASLTTVSGSRDPITLPEFARRYVARAKQLGIPADMVVLPNRGHEILNDPALLDLIVDRLQTLR